MEMARDQILWIFVLACGGGSGCWYHFEQAKAEYLIHFVWFTLISVESTMAQ